MSGETILFGQWAVIALAIAGWLLWFAGRSLWRCWQQAEILHPTSHERKKFIGGDDEN